MSHFPGSFSEYDDPEPEDFAAPYAGVNQKPAASKSIVAAALSGLMMALGWEQDRDQPSIVTTADREPDDWIRLDFGRLDPLGHTDEAS